MMNHDLRFETNVAAQVRILQIISIGLMLGPVIFFIAIMFAVPRRVVEPGAFPVLAAVQGLFALSALVIWSVVPGIVARAGVQRVAEGRPHGPGNRRTTQVEDTSKWTKEDFLLQVRSQNTLIAAAVLEAPIFLAIIVYMLEGHWISLATAGALFLFQLTQFPTTTSVLDWVEYQMRHMEPPTHSPSMEFYSRLDLVERLFEIGDQIFCIFNA